MAKKALRCNENGSTYGIAGTEGGSKDIVGTNNGSKKVRGCIDVGSKEVGDSIDHGYK